ncbi:hypothetical protein M9Y82_17105 [Leptospira weilii]|uniref:hypothetical protein n=3 Tax=Leptospira weilii TaxID=28184 RepID=UPI0020231ADB|nr:hypothetical protein [Leptospira weilii]MCL8268317.1 hypothetical protein [Leptospira weilii]
MFDFLFSNQEKEGWQIKLEIVRYLFNEEEARQDAIERKLLSLQGQVPLFITVIALFYATIFPSIKSESDNIIEGIFLLLSAFFSAIAIARSTKMLNPSKYIYMKIDPETLNANLKNITELQKEIVSDYIISTKNNQEINNRKIEELISARKAFIVSVAFGILMITKIVIVILFADSLNHMIFNCSSIFFWL